MRCVNTYSNLITNLKKGKLMENPQTIIEIDKKLSKNDCNRIIGFLIKVIYMKQEEIEIYNEKDYIDSEYSLEIYNRVKREFANEYDCNEY